MPRRQISFATSNLFNLNEPELRMYRDTDGWSQEEYDKKITWMKRMLADTKADVWSFQELWHADSLQKAFSDAGLLDEYDLLAPQGHAGQKIVCAGAVRKGMLEGDPEWIDRFPQSLVLESGGDDAQTSDIAVRVSKFSRPVLHFKIRPLQGREAIHVYVCHLKAKTTTKIHKEPWYVKDTHSKHSEAIGGAISTIRRTAEAAALRVLLTEMMKGTKTPVVVMGDLNDDQHSNTLNILTGQPNYLLSGLSRGGSDTDLYSAGTLQEYRSHRDVYYTHVYNKTRESLDHILVSQEFYDNSHKRVWAFKGLTVVNDHLNSDKHKDTGTSDHGIVCATFELRPA